MATDPVTVEQPEHPLHAMTTFELRDHRRQLEIAIAFWTVPPSVDTRLSCPIRRESEKWVRHAAHLRRSTRSSR
jgi:hypothetical protein